MFFPIVDSYVDRLSLKVLKITFLCFYLLLFILFYTKHVTRLIRKFLGLIDSTDVELCSCKANEIMFTNINYCLMDAHGLLMKSIELCISLFSTFRKSETAGIEGCGYKYHVWKLIKFRSIFLLIHVLFFSILQGKERH